MPVTALRRGPSGDFVYVINDDRTVTLRPVERGVATNDVIAVTKGLEAGERVVTEGGDRLRDGARVQLPSDRAAAAPPEPRARAAARRARPPAHLAASGNGASGPMAPERRRANDGPR